MQEKEKINVMGKMKSLEVGESFTLKKEDYKLSSVRVTANTIKEDSGLEFTVLTSELEIKVERVK